MEPQTRAQSRNGVDGLVQGRRRKTKAIVMRKPLGARIFLRPSSQRSEKSGSRREPRLHVSPWFQVPEKVDIPRIPQKMGGVLQRLRLCQLDGVAPSIVKPPVRHGGQVGGNREGPAVQTLGRQQDAWDIPWIRTRQPRNVTGGIEAAARIVRIGTGSDPTTADIGVQCLTLDPEPGKSFISINPVHGLLHGDFGISHPRSRGTTLYPNMGICD